MKVSVIQKIISKARKNTPLSIRQKIGPILGWVYYQHRKYILLPHQKPQVLSIRETIAKIHNEELSFIRFGDGEISLIGGMNLPFQKRSTELVESLESIFQYRNKKLLLCIPGMWGNLSVFEPYAEKFIKHHMYREKHTWDKLISLDYVYGDTNITRHYLAYKDKTRSAEIFSSISLLWNKKNILLLEGEKSRLGVGNNLFSNANSLHRILCPQENAFEKINEIINQAVLQSKDTLILLSLGPAAKVIAFRLFLLGYRVIDVGHIDMEYEMYLRKQTKQTKVDHKYFNEINERTPTDCNDPLYLSQIITIIS
jgi:glycosyltransferase family protein